MQPLQHSFPFDPTYGYDETSLRAIGCPAAPPDFESFWRETYAQANKVSPNPTRRLIRESRRMKIYEVGFDASHLDGPIRIGGWMTVPGEGKIDTGIVVGHGYGGRGGPDLSPLIPTAAAIYPCARGFNRSARMDIPDTADRHVLHGIESAETYVHRGCVVDLWAAAWALCELEPQATDWLCYAGASFGGGDRGVGFAVGAAIQARVFGCAELRASSVAIDDAMRWQRRSRPAKRGAEASAGVAIF
jgi:cephalosporin-C deacetylase